MPGDEQLRDVAGSSPFMPRSPDPTAASAAAVERVTEQFQQAIVALRQQLEQRLAGMDEATRLLSERMRETAFSLDEKSAQREATLEALASQRMAAIEQAARTHDGEVTRILESLSEQRNLVRNEFTAADHSLRELLGARIDGMDQATKLLAVNMDKVPSDIDRSILSLRQVLEGEIVRVRDVTLEKFAAVDALFASNATALTAALAAQEKAVAAQNDSNTLAITKSEQTTKETIIANANQTSTGLAGLGVVMDDVKSRVVRMEGLIQSSRTANEDDRAASTFSQTGEANRSVQLRAQVSSVIAAVAVLATVVVGIALVLKK